MKEINYCDQSGTITDICDRRITCFYTPYGIKQLDSNYIVRIRNIDIKVEHVYQIDRRKTQFNGRDGKMHDSLHYTTFYDKVDDIENYQLGSVGIRVTWKNGVRHDFVNGNDYPRFNKKTKMENSKTLRKEILNNPHLHKDIKDNLIDNLDRMLNE